MQLLAVSSVHATDEGELYCAASGACAPCPPSTEWESTGKYFKPVCSSGQCSIIDVRETPLTQCKQDSDCYLRDGVGCCVECDGSGYVSANVNANFCDQTAVACDGCVSQPPAGLSTTCKSGHCALALPTR
jgi:hypothetical protein